MSDYICGKKPRKVRYHFSIVFFAAVVIFGVVFYRYMKSTTLEDVLSQTQDIVVPANSGNDSTEAAGEDSQESDAGSQTAADVTNPVAESEAVNSEYLNRCVFIGDSIMYGLSSYGIVPASNVYASMSMDVSKAETQTIQTQYGEMTILDALSTSMPENIYIMLGTKGAAWMSVSDMYSSFSSFANKVKSTCPGANIYIISVPPVTSAKEQSVESPIKNADIDSFNERLLEYANNNDIYYLDLNSYLKDSTGALAASDAENDGVHFKYSTYEKFIDYILKHTVK